jgi:hypothetical protein
MEVKERLNLRNIIKWGFHSTIAAAASHSVNAYLFKAGVEVAGMSYLHIYSVGIVRSRTQTMEFSLYIYIYIYIYILIFIYKICL